MNEKYNVIFEGKILPEQDINVVKGRVLKHLKVPVSQLDAFFSGQPVDLKKGASLSEATELRKKLGQLGLVVTVSAVSTSTLALSIFPKEVNRAERPINHTNDIPKALNVDVSTREEFSGEYDYAGYQQLSPIPKTFSIDVEGRFGRLNFLNAQLALLLALSPLVILYFALLHFLKTSEYSLLIIMTFSVIYVVFSYRMVVLRLHDMNLSGWFVLLYALGRIPEFGWIIVLLFTAFLVLAPGKKGDNNYGAEPELGSKIGLLVFSVIIPLVLSAIGYIEYQNSGKKKLIEKSLKVMGDLEYSIFEYHEKHKKMPSNISNLSGWQEVLQTSSVIERLNLVSGGIIEIMYNDKIGQDTYLKIAPHVDDNGMIWHCYATNLSYKLLSKECVSEIDTYTESDSSVDNAQL